MCKQSRVRPTPMAVWSELALSYLRLSWRPALILRDEAMLSEPALRRALRQLASLLGEQRGRSFPLPNRLPPVRHGLPDWSPQDYALEGHKMRQRKWLRRYTAEDLAWVNSHLPDEAMQGFVRVTGDPAMLRRSASSMLS
mmetsp:Transcript_73583/g.163537  ORF Transcript_73583/g.163537 Transcript_73583/m.163537 type:complete len:140 (-) Transcript_73583:182-601(-)